MLELFMAIVMVAFGLEGWLGTGALWTALAMRGEAGWWAVILCGIGSWHFGVASFEWLFGRMRCEDPPVAPEGVHASAVAMFLWDARCWLWLHVHQWRERWSSDHAVMSFATCRATALFLSACVWLYVVYMLMIELPVQGAVAMSVISPAALLFCIYSFHGNMKVRTLLDPQMPTSGLERSIMAQRSRVGEYR